MNNFVSAYSAPNTYLYSKELTPLHNRTAEQIKLEIERNVSLTFRQNLEGISRLRA